MAGNLFQLNHNFLTHKCPSLSTKRHLFKHTEIYGPSEMIAYAPQDIFQTLPVPVRLCFCKKRTRSCQCDKTNAFLYKIVTLTLRPNPSNILKSVVNCTSAFPFSRREIYVFFVPIFSANCS